MDFPTRAYSCLPATVLASCVESVWSCGGGNKAQTQLSRALWLWCGSLGARVWLPLLPRDATRHPDSSRHTFMAKRIMLPFHLNIYPLTILFDDAILLGAENDTTLYSSDTNSVFSLPFCVVNRTSQVYLHQILRQLLRRNLGYHAWEIARSCAQLPYFPHSLELLLHEVLEEEATSKEPIPDAQLPSIIEFVHEFPVYLQTVVQCARKTEIALWAYLFSAAGKPKELFQECLQRKMLDTAASYLIILQNLESSAVSRHLATQLLDTALQHERWDLARDLVRFLRAIDTGLLFDCRPTDPNDVDSPRNSVNVQAKYGQIVQSQTVSPNAEDLSVILGNMQLSGGRGRSFSTTASPRAEAEPPAAAAPAPPPPARATAAVKRKKSVPTRQDKESYSGTAEEFFIDMMIQRHARLLLSTARLHALGKMAAALDLHLVAWLAGERERAARVDSAVLCLRRLHEDFAWPYPAPLDTQQYSQRKGSTVTSEYCGWGGRGPSDSAGTVDSAVLCLRRLHEDFAWPYPAPLDTQRKCSTVTSKYCGWGERGPSDSAGTVDSAVLCLRRLHEDFAWPYPAPQDTQQYSQRKGSTVTSEYCGWSGRGPSDSTGTVDSALLCLRRLHEDFARSYPVTSLYTPSADSDSLCGDSGYMSLPLRAAPPGGVPVSPGPVSSVGEGSVAEGGVAWASDGGEERRYAALMERLHHHQAERGEHTAHVQLRCRLKESVNLTGQQRVGSAVGLLTWLYEQKHTDGGHGAVAIRSQPAAILGVVLPPTDDGGQLRGVGAGGGGGAAGRSGRAAHVQRGARARRQRGRRAPAACRAAARGRLERHRVVSGRWCWRWRCGTLWPCCARATRRARPTSAWPPRAGCVPRCSTWPLGATPSGEWALVLAVALRDALAVLRTCNAARAPDVSVAAARRLRAALQHVAAWSDTEW
ncbi:hypothetical protein MSG28_008821 [Choristoneura fumiferana]|uniref:Uncharacterized protein n=1 Tax=Choristoneura fumiferana TaxID=7141 RepID=A0ACC0J855_CHOFU|nr:hypothetical protein MSG28_008821 [Choristoneura fumiferana]